MIQIHKYKILLTMILQISLIIIIAGCKQTGSNFKRVQFSQQIMKDTKIKRDLKTDKHTPVNQGNRIRLNGKKQMQIDLPFRGKLGVMFFLDFKSTYKDSNIIFELYRMDMNSRKKHRLHFVQTPHFKSEVIEKFSASESDALFVQFNGIGDIFISDPIVYRRVEREKRSHVFIIGIDTFRQSMMSQIVNGKSITPHLDRFKKDSIDFKNCYSQSSWTLPGFISFFTALNEYNHNVGIKSTLDPAIPSLVERLSEKFITLGLHGGIVMSKRWGHARGFDLYKEFKFAGLLYPYGGRSLFEKAIDIIDAGEFPELFFFLHTYQIHDPYTPPKEYLDRINPSPLQQRADLVNNAKPEKTFVELDEQIRKSVIELYQAEIMAFDDFFGGFIAELKKRNIYQQSTIILMSDHGEEFFDHRGWGHSHSLYQELIKVPLMIKFPNQRFAASEINPVISNNDILPTLLDYYKIPLDSNQIDGESVLDKLETGDLKKKKLVISSMTGSRYFEAIPEKFAIIGSRYKIIYNFKPSQKQLDFFKDYLAPPEVRQLELYDLINDPEERTNLSRMKPELIKKYMPYIKRIRNKIEKNRSRNTHRRLDPDVEKQLKTIGYI